MSAYDVAAAVADPELPMLTLGDLGILRSVEHEGDAVVATITPTYSGCPAMREISADLHYQLRRAGYSKVAVRTQLAPAWSSDWITDEGRRKLAEAGIAPPGAVPRRTGPIPLTLTSHRAMASPPCPHCGSVDTTQTAAFSATACKSLHRCTECREPFEQVKAI